jgi:hypothetical protein
MLPTLSVRTAAEFGLFEQMQVDQTVMKDNIGLAQTSEAPHSDEVRIPWSGSNDEYSPEMVHNRLPLFFNWYCREREKRHAKKHRLQVRFFMACRSKSVFYVANFEGVILVRNTRRPLDSTSMRKWLRTM